MARIRSTSPRRERRADGGRAEGKRSYRNAALTVVVLAVMAGIVFLARGASAHPTPREGVTADEVVHHSHYQGYPRIQSVYKQAKQIPQVLDGLHCYCDCGSHSGHYSLLDCFRSDHGAGCDVCLTSAALAYQMTREGKSLEEIRDAIDQHFER